MKNPIAIHRIARASLALALVPALLASAANAANTITGTVTDEAGSAIANIAVTASDLLDGRKVGSSRSDGTGMFSFASLPVGSYLVSAETLNTPWVQKTASPVVAISDAGEASLANVPLVLVNLSQLSQADGSGLETVEIAAFGASLLAATGSILAYLSAEDANDTSKANHEQLRQLAENVSGLQGKIDEALRRLNKNGENIDQILRDLQAFREQLNRELLKLNDKLFKLQQVVDRIEFSLYK